MEPYVAPHHFTRRHWLLISLLLSYSIFKSDPSDNEWLVDMKLDWIPAFGISLHLALDGLSLVMLILDIFSRNNFSHYFMEGNRPKVGSFHFNLLLILAGITGVFLSLDLFLFYFFWEFMLVPMYFLIGIWGHENRTAASNKFFLYTQASGLLMFISIIALYFVHGHSTGIYTFDYLQLLGTRCPLQQHCLLCLDSWQHFL